MPTENKCQRRAYRWDHAKSAREGDYLFAANRFGSGKSHPAQRYDFARRFIEALSSRRKREKYKLADAFREQVERWKDETGHLSSLTKAISHPSYLRIIGLANESTGHEIERLILHELESEPDHWFAALSAVTGEDPVKPEHDFDDAVAAWLAWGREKDII
jgi:hypothetical protein